MYGHDYISLGSAPYDEDCAQVGSPDYEHRAKLECRRYKRQLERDFPIPDGINAEYSIKRFSHDFGSYYEVAIVYNEEDEASLDFAYDMADHTPARWEIPEIKNDDDEEDW